MLSTQQPGTNDTVNTQNVWHCCLLFFAGAQPILKLYYETAHAAAAIIAVLVSQCTAGC
jgi:hypothetical protein